MGCGVRIYSKYVPPPPPLGEMGVCFDTERTKQEVLGENFMGERVILVCLAFYGFLSSCNSASRGLDAPLPDSMGTAHRVHTHVSRGTYMYTYIKIKKSLKLQSSLF